MEQNADAGASRGAGNKPFPEGFDRFSCAGYFRIVFLPFCTPKDILRMAGVTKQCRATCVSDTIWEPLVEGIEKGDFLKDLKTSNALIAHQKRMVDAFMEACRTKCCRCGAYAQFFNVFAWKKICYGCWDAVKEDPQFGLINKTRAKEIYLLTDRDFKNICSLVAGNKNKPLESTFLLSRPQCETVALAKYGGMQGLLKEKAKREKKSRERYGARIKDYERKKEEALKAGKKAPSYPRMPKHTDTSDDGGFMVPYFRNHVLSQVGFPSPSGGEGGGISSVCYCKRCVEAEPQKKTFMFPCYPDEQALWSEHIVTSHPEAVSRMYMLPFLGMEFMGYAGDEASDYESGFDVEGYDY